MPEISAVSDNDLKSMFKIFKKKNNQLLITSDLKNDYPKSSVEIA
jgi:hypothetical protein